MSSAAGNIRRTEDMQLLLALRERMAEHLFETEAFGASSPPPALTSSAAFPTSVREVDQVQARLAWLESEMHREQSGMDEYRAELLLLEQKLCKQYAGIDELIAFREQLDLRFPEAAVADPAPAPAVADPEERQRDQVEAEKEEEERQRD